MKPPYRKPTFVKRDVLSGVTAGGASVEFQGQGNAQNGN
jgi:hypothetical protein